MLTGVVVDPETLEHGPLPIERMSNQKDLAMTDKEVKLYTLSTCSHCKSTKRLLAECTIEYDFVDVDLLEGEERKAILEDIKKVNPRCSFPTLIIGDKVVVGYKEKEIKEALGL
jgi:glutaredoxin-like protein NrdH